MVLPKVLLKKNLWFLLIVLITGLFLAVSAYLQPIAWAADADLDNFNIKKYLTAPGQDQKYFTDATNKKISPVGAFLLLTIDYLLMLISTIAIGTIVVGSLMLITSQGNENQLEKGKNAIKFAIIGLIVAFASYIISLFVQSLFYI